LNHLYWYFNDKPQSSCEFGLSEPKLIINNNYKKAADEINELMQETNKKYIDILRKNKVTSNMFLIAQK